MHSIPSETPRNDVHNSVEGDVDAEADVTQVGHLDHDEESSNAVHNSVRGTISGNARVLQAGNITGNIRL